MVVDGCWRDWDSFCRRECAIYTEWKNQEDGLALCIRNHRAIHLSNVRVLVLRSESTIVGVASVHAHKASLDGMRVNAIAVSLAART